MRIDSRSEERSLELEKLGRRFFRQALPLTFVANCLIAGFLTVLTRDALGRNLVYSHSIGFTILLLHFVGHRVIRGSWIPHWVVTAVALPVGSVLGVLLSWWVLDGAIHTDPEALPFTIASVLVLGGSVTYFFYSRARLAIADARHKAHELEREEGAPRVAEAELKLLQAQIEPHFLFNTLSNVLSLIDADPARAKRMLLNLTSYLRGSLRRTRAEAVTVGEELDLVRAYLEIQAVRMGARLRPIDFGVVETSPDDPLPVRLQAVHRAVADLVALHQPAVVGVERLFFSRNVQTAFAVGQARGVVLLAAAQHGTPVREATPNEVKSAITGYGGADKEQVQRMVQLVLAMTELPRPDDAADALAVAVCTAHAARPTAVAHP